MNHRVGVLLCDPVSVLLRSDGLYLNIRVAVGEHKDGIYLAAEVGRLAARTHPIVHQSGLFVGITTCKSLVQHTKPTSMPRTFCSW